jgi:hypothetical protein
MKVQLKNHHSVESIFTDNEELVAYLNANTFTVTDDNDVIVNTKAALRDAENAYLCEPDRRVFADANSDIFGK